MATLAAAFARYFVQLVPPPAAIARRGLAGGRGRLGDRGRDRRSTSSGTRRGGTLQVVGTVLKVGGVAAPDRACRSCSAGRARATSSPVWPDALDGSLFTGMMAAMVGVLWAYDGWINVTPLAEEIRDPGRNIPRALILGMATLIAVYLGMTLAYHYVLPMAEVAAAEQGRGGHREGRRRGLLPALAGRLRACSRSRSWSCARRSSRSTATR